jgi:RNA recognition motif-containing protein
MNIYVSNLAYNIQDEELKNLFTPYGEVSSAKVVNDRETGRSKGFGFVEMGDDNAAREAIHQLDQSSLDGNLKIHTPKALLRAITFFRT